MSGLARLAARAERAHAPLSALFELTGRCNLDCGHCHLDIAHPPEELSTDEACAVIDQLADAGTLFLTLSGGELFLRKDALAVAAYARARGLAIRLFTNATRIDRSLAHRIAELAPLSVEVSLYGSHGAHDRVARRPGTLARTLRGLVHLRRAGVPLVLKAPLLGALEIDPVAALADRLGARLVFDPFVKPRLDGNAAPLAWRADDATLSASLRHPRAGVLPATGELPAPPHPDEAPCAVGRRVTRIAPNGDVFACSAHPTPLGNLRQRRFADIWAGGPLLDRLRAARWRDLQVCSDCSQSGYCGRCAAVALKEDGDQTGPSSESCRIASAKERALGLPSAPTNGRVRLRVL